MVRLVLLALSYRAAYVLIRLKILLGLSASNSAGAQCIITNEQEITEVAIPVYSRR
jgi:hypothetical protein